MYCGVCSSPFDETERRPKLLSPCGHTFCLHCLLEMAERTRHRIKCPSCKERVSQRAPTMFTDNFALLSVVKSRHQAPENKDIRCRYWCVTCSTEASPGCESAGHDTRGLLGFRRRQVEAQLEGLRQDLSAAGQRTQQLQVGPWDKQLQRGAELILQGSGELDKELKLLTCCETVSIASDTWRVEGVELEKQPALRIAMLLLLQQHAGRQQQPQQQQQQQEKPAKPEEMDLKSYCLSGPDAHREEKVALLQRDVTMRALEGVCWSRDPCWVRALLLVHADTLHRLDVSLDSAAACNPLCDLACMPGLHKLVLRCCSVALTVPERWRGQLHSLSVLYCEPENSGRIVARLLRAHRSSLQEVTLTEVSREQMYELQQMPALRKLHLTYFNKDMAKNNSVLPEYWRGQLRSVTVAAGWPGKPHPAVLRLLKSHRNSLEEVGLVNVSRELLLELQLMPALRKLDASLREDCLWQHPAVPRRWKGQLQLLQVRGSPRQAAVLSLLKAVGYSLQELHLQVGLPSECDLDKEWLDTCDDLPALLRECDLKRLRSLELTKSSDFHEWHETPCGLQCSGQLEAVRAVLPGCSVKCTR